MTDMMHHEDVMGSINSKFWWGQQNAGVEGQREVAGLPEP